MWYLIYEGVVNSLEWLFLGFNSIVILWGCKRGCFLLNDFYFYIGLYVGERNFVWFIVDK